MRHFILIFFLLITAKVILAQSADSSTSCGFILGSYSYPGEYIPADLKICAVSVSDSTATYCTTIMNRKNFTYKMKLPAGEYFVYAETKDITDKAYYSEFVLCGMNVNCPCHKKIIVKVIAKKKTKNINPTDWYHNGIIGQTYPSSSD